MISLGFMGGGGNSVRQGLLKISGGEGGGGKERCIFVFCILNTSLKVFCISNTFQVLYLYLVFQIHFKCCICILYFKYKLHVFDPTLSTSMHVHGKLEVITMPVRTENT